MIEKTAGEQNVAAQVAQEFFKALGHGDAAERPHLLALEKFQRLAFVRAETLQILGAVRALDDVNARIVPVDEVFEFGITLAVGLGKENVAGTLKVLDRLAQNAARQEVAVAKGIGLVDEQQVEPALERKILKTVVEDQRVAAEFFDGVGAGLHAVLVHEHDHAGEIAREHVGLVARLLGVEQYAFSVAHDAGRRLGGVRKPIPPLFPHRRRLALVAARQDRDVPSAVAQGTGEFFHDGRLASAADGKIAHHDHEAAERLVVQDAFAVEPQTRLGDAVEQYRK